MRSLPRSICVLFLLGAGLPCPASADTARTSTSTTSTVRGWKLPRRFHARWRLARRRLEPVRGRLADKCQQLKHGCRLAITKLRQSRVVRRISAQAHRASAGYQRTRKRVTHSPLYRKLRARTRRLKARYRSARQRFKRSRLGKGLHRASMQARGRMTLLADRIELSVSPSLRPVVRRIRDVSPLSLTSFAMHRIKQYPALAGYPIFSFAFSNLQMPVLYGMGLGFWGTLGIRLLTGIPVDLAILLAFEHYQQRKRNPDQTLRMTWHGLRTEYSSYQEQRRELNRQYMQRYRNQQRPSPQPQEQQGSLRRLAAPLVERGRTMGFQR